MHQNSTCKTQKNMFYLFYSIIWVITLAPLKILYLLSDITYPVIYYIVRYRRKVVRKNLLNSFPDKNIKDIIKIEKKFYRYFCDLMMETAAQIHMSKKEISRRVKYQNTELITEQFNAGKSLMFMSAHYCNWEWMSSIKKDMPTDSHAFGIYKKLSNKHFDQFMINLRNKYGGEVIETQDLFRTMLQLRNEKAKCIFGMISDQTPTAASSRHWITFLNQDTTVLIGTEQLAKKFNYPVYFFNIERPKRGYYHCDITLIEADPLNADPYSITEKYMKILEQKINEHPEFWLWTHKRWKHRRL